MTATAGIVITTHNRWQAAYACIESVLRWKSSSTKVYVYDNESTDQESLAIPRRFPGIEYTRIDDQTAGGGLTGTWNLGAARAIAEGCEVVVFLNHDTVVNATWSHLVAAAAGTTSLAVFGPLSDNPGVAPCHQAKSLLVTHADLPSVRLGNSFINGFCFAVRSSTLLANCQSDGEFFEPSLPFRGNEVEFQNRLWEKGGLAYVVDSCYVDHVKFRDWAQPDTPNVADEMRDFNRGKNMTPSQLRVFCETRLAAGSALDKAAIYRGVLKPLIVEQMAYSRTGKTYPDCADYLAMKKILDHYEAAVR